MIEPTSLYIHIPFCISKCAYCDFFSRAGNKSLSDDYISALCNEISFRIKNKTVSELQTIYIGGGTPSLLSKNQFQKIFSHIRSLVKLGADAEITVEVNPDDVSKDLLDALAEGGVNRISCGIQSMNDKALKRACRRADEAVNFKALSLLKEFWQGDVSVDLISGLPEDDERGVVRSLKTVCEINPAHISLYSLTIEEETPFGKQLESGVLNYDFDVADKLWLMGRDYLEKAGYKWYEVSNFCKPGKECRHNLAYWTHKGYLGCGSGGTGTVYSEDGSGARWTNTQKIEDYIDFWKGLSDFESLNNFDLKKVQVEETIDLQTSEFEFFMMSLRKLSGFYESEYIQIFGKNIPETIIKRFEEWQKKGLCEIKKVSDRNNDIQYSMTREGMLFLNRFLEELV